LTDKLGNYNDFGFLLIKAFEEPDAEALKDLLKKIPDDCLARRVSLIKELSLSPSGLS
jgi:hypothetical protein